MITIHKVIYYSHDNEASPKSRIQTVYIYKNVLIGIYPILTCSINSDDFRSRLLNISMWV